MDGFRLAQKRMLLCAALFSFGTLSGAITASRISDSTIAVLNEKFVAVVLQHPYLMLPAGFLLGPFLMIVFGLSPTGALFLSALLLLFGFFTGAVEFIVFRIMTIPLLPAAYIVPYALGIVLVGECMLRSCARLRSQLLSGGRVRPDYATDIPRLLCTISILALSAFCLAIYCSRC